MHVTESKPVFGEFTHPLPGTQLSIVQVSPSLQAFGPPVSHDGFVVLVVVLVVVVWVVLDVVDVGAVLDVVLG